MRRIAIIGGGIAGLAAAYELQKSPAIEVTIFESAPRFGGKLGTIHEGDLTIEQTADSIFTLKPAALEFMHELGLETELIEPLGNEFSMLIDGKLHSIPRALATLWPTVDSLQSVAFLSEVDKVRALAPVSVNIAADDISIAGFFRARFGPRFSELVVEPLFAGIHAGAPEKLSMKALFPGYLNPGPPRPIESALIEGSSGNRTTFVGLRSGMGSCVERLLERLGTATLRKSTRVAGMEHHGATIRLKLEADKTFEADHVIIATPAYVASQLLAPVRAEVAQLLGEIRHISTAVVTLAFNEDGFTTLPTGNGFLVPYTETCGITGCTISSNKWPGRAPQGQVLLRVFLGRDGGLDVDAATDASLVVTAKQSVQEILGVTNAVFERLDRWPKAMAQYDLNHLVRMKEIEDLLQDLPVTLAGGSYRGTGIPDCVRQGREAARSLLSGFTPSENR